MRTSKLLTVLAGLMISANLMADDTLWQLFQQPKQEACTKVWWFHGETVTTREGIDADLEAFKEKGLGGVVYYDQVHSKAEGAFEAMSPEWWDMLKYAAQKAKQLGLIFEVAASNGYVAGGPWITPEMGMQQVAFVDSMVTVNRRQKVTLQLKYPREGFHDVKTLLFADREEYREYCVRKAPLTVEQNAEAIVNYDAGRPVGVSTITFSMSPRGKGSTGSMNMPGEPQERFFGAGYIDFPPIGHLEYSTDGKHWQQATDLPNVENVIGHKSKERTVNFPAVKARYFRVRLHDWMDAEGTVKKLTVENIRISSRDKIHNWEVKTGLRTEVLYPHEDGGNKGVISSKDIKDITSNINSDGTLTIDLPAGTWHILRMGYIPTGGHTKHGRKNLLGLEANVMSHEAAELHYRHYFGAICDTLAAIGCKPQAMHMDSHEAGIQNWTAGFEQTFHRLTGYDIIPWLPALAGYIVDSRQQTEQTLLDFRKAIAKTIGEEFYATFARLCHEDGVEFVSQAMLNIECDNIASRGYADKPQGEFWGYQKNGNYDCLDCTSAAHLYGHNISSTEAFSDSPYSMTWDELLRIGNLAYCRGVNEFVVCAASYQPWLDRKYDDSQSLHPYVFHRLNPNWETSTQFWAYQSRCTQLLQVGRPVVDLCVYIGEDTPLKTMAYKLPVIPEGYQFDVCTYDALMNRMTARDGVLHVTGGMTYRALLVQNHTYLSPAALAKLQQLEREGVCVVWCNQGEDVAEKLHARGIQPDLRLQSANKPDDRTTFYHRQTATADIYFVYNHSNHVYEAPVKPRARRQHAELWDALNATRTTITPDDDNTFHLQLKPYESVFIVMSDLSAPTFPLPRLPVAFRAQVGPQAMPDTIAPIKAPFEMAQLQRPVFPNQTVTVKMNRKGLSTKNIQQTIDRLAKKGGGKVVIPSGDWQTGRITLRSNINLHLAEGCRLHFSGQIADYQPAVFTRDEGIEIYSLGAFIYANGERNIAITGQGEMIGPSTDCEIYQQNHDYCLNIEKIVGEKPLDERRYDGQTVKEVFLPKTIAPINCTNVLIEGITLTQGLYWNVVPQYCDSVIIRGVTVNSFGHGRTDGIDVESSSNVLIEYCSLDCQDDCYTMKSGRGWDGLRINRPTERVVVRHCLALRGAGGIVAGTEVAGNVKNVFCHDCVFDGTDQAFRVKSRRTRGGGIENFFVERVRANVKYQAFYCDLLGEPKWMGELAQRFPTPPRTKYTPYFHDISVHDVVIEHCRDLISFTGQPELPVKNVFFGNATVSCERIGHVQDVTGFAMKDVTIESKDSVLTLDGCSIVNIFGMNSLTYGQAIKVEQKGQPSKYVSVQEVPMQPVAYHSVRPGKVWLDTDGKPIQAHGFQICYADGKYYWYGENKADALLGTTRMFGGVRCYSSRDFYNWKDEGLLLAPDTVKPLSPIHYSQKLERPHIIRNPRTGKYILWAKSQAEDGYFAIFQADRFMGPYTFVRNLQPEGYGVGDFDMYVDEQTGKGYVWFERPHWELICAELTDDFTDVTEVFSNHFVGQKPPFTREAPAHFFADGKHYLFTSGTTGYTSNPTEVAEFDDYHGEYRILGDPHVNDSTASSFNSQITGIVKIPDRDLWIALADRWEPHTTGTDFSRRTVEAKKDAYANYQPQPRKTDGSVPQVVDRRYKLVDAAHAVYHAGYVFLPIIFENGIPKIHWQDEWQIE